jgi:hypothetical protein
MCASATGGRSREVVFPPFKGDAMIPVQLSGFGVLMSYSGSRHRTLGTLAVSLLFTFTGCAESTDNGGAGDGTGSTPSDASASNDEGSSDAAPTDVSADQGPAIQTDATTSDSKDGGTADISTDVPGEDAATGDGSGDAGTSDADPNDEDADGGTSADASEEDAAPGDVNSDIGDVVGPCTADQDCEAQNSCWEATCDLETGTCGETQRDEGVACDDGNACSSGDSCTADGWCLGLQAVTCVDDNPCTDDTCSPGTGCDFKNNFAACDDGDPCTIGEQCGGGTCTGASPLCEDENPCTTDTCDPTSGSCDFAADDTAPCDDGSSCTEGDACIGGVCTPGAVDACDDSNLCTSDDCVAGACTSSVLDGEPCDDGDACTQGDLCSEDSCTAGAPVGCDDQNACTEDLCDSASGCATTVLEGTVCEDNNACSTESLCNAAAQCATTAELVCDDQNDCTEDGCSSDSGCFFTATINACDDDDICTGQDTCQADGSCVGAAEDCDDGDACTQDTCDSETGCAHGDTSAGCDLGNPCMVYGCNTQTGCTEQASSEPCDDLDLCTGPDLCSDGSCSGAGLTCDDEDPCTADSCDPEAGCEHVAQDIPCDDGDACTQDEACELTDPFCNGGVPVDEDDLVDCTIDACQGDVGVTHTPDTGACQVGETCDPDDGCIPGSPTLVISKYNLAPTDLVSNGQGQWIAVTNVGDTFMDLTEIYLLNSVSAMALIKAPSGDVTEPVLIAPGETLAGLKTPAADPPVAPEPFHFFFTSAENPNFGWDPDEDEIHLVDEDFNTVDSVLVKAVNQGPFSFNNQSPVVLGRATEFDQAALGNATHQDDNNDALLWCAYDELGEDPASESLDCGRARINEVALAEADGERFIELHLPFGGQTGDVKIRLLDAEGGAVQTVLVSNTRMPVGQTLVYTDGVDGVAWNTLIDGAVALLRGDELLDLYGFGTLNAETDAVVGHPMVEGAAGPAQAQGQSAARANDGVDTENNASDFVATTPSPGQLNAP